MLFSKAHIVRRNIFNKALLSPPANPVWREVWRLIWLALAFQLLLALVSFSPKDPSWSTWVDTNTFDNWMGRMGSIQADLFLQSLGLPSFILVFLLGAVALRKSQDPEAPSKKEPGLIIPFSFLISICALTEALISASWLPWNLPHSGGVIGYGIYSGLFFLSGEAGALGLSLLLVISTTILLFQRPLFGWLQKHANKQKLSPSYWWATLRQKFKKEDSLFAEPTLTDPRPQPTSQLSLPRVTTETELVSEPEITELTPKQGIFDFLSFNKTTKPTKPKPTRRADNSSFCLPPVSMLSKKSNRTGPLDREWFVEKSRILVEKLNDFGVEGEIVNISPGPVITVYEFKPASGVKIKEIANLSDDLTLALSVLSVRIVAPIPGKPVVGIEIPSPERQTVLFREMLEETPFYDDEIKIPILLGRLASGDPILADLSSMPHLLVAGATGTGKSVFVNSLIASLLYRFTPDELKLMLVDPKMVELSQYEGIPHLLLPVVVDSKKAAMALRWAVDEMEKRYSMLHQAGVRHLEGYNAKIRAANEELPEEEQQPTLPFIVIIVDEYADLMAVVPKEVEMSITRLAQKARASGIHLVLATQRPSTDVVTGLIKANFPSRISFRVASGVDSKTILDRTGAERLLGKGDLLLHSAGFTVLKRMQGAFISDTEIDALVSYLHEQGEPQYDEGILENLDEETSPVFATEKDSESARLYDQAVQLVAEKGEASISLVQRHLRIGYNRAAMLMEEMEKQGVVAPSTGNSKRRTVLISHV